MSTSMYRMFYQQALEIVRKWHADYEEEVRVWYEEGDGRDPDWCTEIVEGSEYRFNAGGKGYRFPHCIHGTSLWTDYDNICPGCEDSLTVRQEASSLAREWFAEWCNRVEFMRSVPVNLPAELREGISVWALRTLDVFAAKAE